MWVCSKCQSRHETDRMFCPKCGAPAPPKSASPGAPGIQQHPAQRPPQQSQPARPAQPAPRVNISPQAPQRPQTTPSPNNYRPNIPMPPPMVDDIEPTPKRKTDPLAIAQKQVLRAAERFKEVDATVEDPDEHLTWDSAKSLERSIDNVKRGKEKHQDHLYGDGTRPVTTPERKTSSHDIFDSHETHDDSTFAFTPIQLKAVYAAAIALIALVAFLIGEVVDQSNAAAPADSSEQVNIFTGRVSLSKLEGLWLGTDTVNGVASHVEYLFNDPGSLTVVTLSPNGSVTGAVQSTYSFTQGNLNATVNGQAASGGLDIPPTTSTIVTARNTITIQAPDRTIVLHRPEAIVGSWTQVGTEGGSYRYVFNSGGSATIPDPSATTSPKPVTANYLIAGNVLTLTVRGASTPPSHWNISFDGADLVLTSLDSGGASSTIHLHQS